MVRACVLIRTRRGEFSGVVEAVSKLPSVLRVFPVLGRYDVVADVEAESLENLSRTVVRMSKISGVVFTETLIELKEEEKKC